MQKIHSLEEIDHGVCIYKNHETLTSSQLNYLVSIVISPEAILRDASGDGVQAEGGQLAYKTDSGKYKVQLVPASGYFTQLTTDNYIEG